MLNLSPTATSILTLLNNINELIVKSSDRKNAEEVMKALRVYAKGKGFLTPEDPIDTKIQNFFAILNDARPYTTTVLILDIAKDVIAADTKNKKTSYKKSKAI